MDDLASHVAHRRAQLAELRVMAAADHYGAADAVARLSAELRQLGAEPEAEPTDDQVADQLAAAAAPAAAVEPVDTEAETVRIVRPRSSRAKARSKAKRTR